MVSFCYYLLAGDTVAPSGLLPRLYDAVLVYFFIMSKAIYAARVQRHAWLNDKHSQGGDRRLLEWHYLLDRFSLFFTKWKVFA